MVTLAPSAYKMTWAEIIHRVPDATLVRTLGDNTFEALYIVNILDQVCRNCLCFATDPPCRSPLRVFDAPTGSSCIRAWAYRVEFQEGEHMHQPSYVHGSYHGTDVQRAHLCLWCTEDVHQNFLQVIERFFGSGTTTTRTDKLADCT